MGTKTTFRFVNNNWSRIYTRRQPRGCDEEALMLFGNGAVRFLHGLNAKYRAVGKHIYFMAPEFALNARGTYKKSAVVMDEIGYIRVKGRNSPPTGIEGLFFALEVCDTVDLYGFQVSHGDQTCSHHRYPPPPSSRNEWKLTIFRPPPFSLLRSRTIPRPSITTTTR